MAEAVFLSRALKPALRSGVSSGSRSCSRRNSTSAKGRVVAIARDPDLPLAGATYRDYAPAVPTTTDGIVAGLLGFLLGWGGWRLIAETGRRMARPRRRPETTPV